MELQLLIVENDEFPLALYGLIQAYLKLEINLSLYIFLWILITAPQFSYSQVGHSTHYYHAILILS